MPSTPKTDASLAPTVDQNSTDKQFTVDQTDNESQMPPPTTSPSLQASPATADDIFQKQDEGCITQLDRNTYNILTDEYDGDDYYRSLFLPQDPGALSRLFSIHQSKAAPQSHSRAHRMSHGISKTDRYRQPPRGQRTARRGGFTHGGGHGEESNAGDGPSVCRESVNDNKQGGVIVESKDTLPTEKVDDETAYLRDGLRGVFVNHGWE